MANMEYKLTALRGVQAGREYYLAMFPWNLIPKILTFDEEDYVEPGWRAQRTLNKARIPEIARYLVENPKDYVFSALTCSISSNVIFDPFVDHKGDINNDMGWLSIPMDATILINDGQHRRAAIIEALKASPDLKSEHIPIVLFVDAGLKRSQQMFADLNKHAIRPSLSLGVLYEHRDDLAELSRTICKENKLFMTFTELEKTSISNRSAKLFTLSALYQATGALLRKKKDDTISDKESKLALDFFDALSKTIPEWSLVVSKKMLCSEARTGYVHSHAVALVALGRAGADLVSEYPDSWSEKIKRLANLDWSRTNQKLWEGRAMLQGRVSKAKRNETLTVNIIKQTLGLSLSASEQEIEDEYTLPE